MEETSKLPLPETFLNFLEVNGIDPSIYSASDTIPRYIRLKPGNEACIGEIEAKMKCKLEKVDWLPGFYSLPPDIQIANSKAYQQGQIYGIDAASGAAVSALDISGGDHVLDLCAAPGAKLCMILDLLGDLGSVTGVDVARHRLAACRTMLQKYGLGDRCRLFVADGTMFSLIPVNLQSPPISCKCNQPGESALRDKDDIFLEWTSRRPWKERKKAAKLRENMASQLVTATEHPELIFYGQHSGVVGLRKSELYKTFYNTEILDCGYDKVLVDAECTHDGSIRHIQKFEHWGWTTLQRRVLDAERTDRSLTALQLKLLTNGFRLLKVGGSLVYSTCSLTVTQNEDVVEQFLKENPSAELQEIDAAKDWPCKKGEIPKTWRFDPLTSQTSGLFVAKFRKLAVEPRCHQPNIHIILVGAAGLRKWLGFVTAIWVQAVCGNNYTFSNYSDALKSLMGLSQLELNNLSVAKDVGKAFGIFSGLASDCLPTSVILIIGSLEGLIGYGFQWLVVSRRISPLSYWQMCIFLCMGGNSTTWMNTAVLVTCMRNFPKNRGPVSGILKGYVGLSTAIFTDISTAIFSSNPSPFLLMLALVPAIICLLAALFLRETAPASGPEEDKQESKFFQIFNAMAIVVAIYLLAFDITGSHGHVLSIMFAGGLLILLASPLIVPVYALLSKSRLSSDIEQAMKQPLLVDQRAAEAQEDQTKAVNEGLKAETVDQTKRKPAIGEDHTIFEMIQTLDFWILFMSFLCGVGTGMCVMNNMAQMGLALGFADASIFVSLTSIWGFFGRIFSGLLSEHYMRKSGTPRLIWNAASQILMAAGFIIMALALPGSLYIGSILVGICYGVRLTITVAVASELFGLKYYGLLYNILILNLPLGSFLFSGLLAGYLYDAQATASVDGSNTCVGAHCYGLVFFVMAATCVIGFGLDMLLTNRTKNVYCRSHHADNKKSGSAAAGHGLEKP